MLKKGVPFLADRATTTPPLFSRFEGSRNSTPRIFLPKHSFSRPQRSLKKHAHSAFYEASLAWSESKDLNPEHAQNQARFITPAEPACPLPGIEIGLSPSPRGSNKTLGKEAERREGTLL